jgi:carbon-monoxide dehydrogenase large subunit
VHDNCPSNIVVEGRFKTADFDATVARAHKIVRVDARPHRQNATPLEARAAHAAFDAASGRVTLTCTTQMPHLTRTAIADSLQFPESDLRVVAPDVGGGFGQKMSLPAEYVFLVWLAQKLRTTVAWSEDRRENLIAAFHSRDQHVQLEGAFDAAGKLMALSSDVVANIGAYSCFPTTCGVEPLMAMAESPGPYDVRAYSCVARGVATNTCTMAPYRGVSRPVITFAIERLMDKAAAALDLGPDEIRRRNLIREFPYTSATGLVFDEGSYVETLEQAIAHVDLKGFRAQQSDARTRGRYRGIGFATFSERTGYGSPAFAARGMEITPGWETVEITMDPSGAVEARIGASPHGQGLRTTLAQIIADQVGIAPEHVRIVHGDTDRTPYGWGTFASRSLVIAGGASLLAAQKIRKKLLTIASHVLEAATDDIVLEDGDAKVSGTDRTVTIAALARAAYHQTHAFKGEITPGLSRRHRRGRYRDRPHKNRKIPRGGGCRPHHQSADCRRPGAWRHRPRHWQRAVRGDRLRRQRQSADRDACRLHAADRVRNPADRTAPHRIAGRVLHHRRQGLGRRRHDRRPGRDPQRHQRRAIAVRRVDRRNPGNAAAGSGGDTRFRNRASGIRDQGSEI